MMESIKKMQTYFIKKLYFSNEDNSIVELISVTEETIEIVNGIQVIKPKIIASSIREFDLKAVDLDISESKIFISEKQAYHLSEYEEDQEYFLNLVNSIF